MLYRIGAGVLACCCLMAGGCVTYSAPVQPPTGLLFTSVDAPLDIDAEKTPYSPKYGEASSSTILGLFTFGDSSLDTAARNGNIQTLEYIDYHYLNVLFIYQNFTTRVHGE